MTQYHFIEFDPPGVQRIILKTNKLKEIRATSTMLESRGENELKDLIRKFNGKPLRLAGGGGAVFVPSEHKDTFLQQLKTILANELPGVDFVITNIPHEPGATPSQTVRLAKLKHSLPVLRPTPLLGPSSLGCASCRSAPAAQVVSHPEEKTELLCQRCCDKREPNQRDSKYQSRLRELAKANPNWPKQLSFANDLIGISAETKSRAEYLAMVRFDGNGMGKYFKKELAKLRNLDECEQFKANSDAIKKNMVEAFAKAVLNTWPDGYRSYVPAEMLYLGGDDAVMVCAADRAFQLAQNAVKAFKANENLEQFSLAIGIVFARHNTPMKIMLDLSADLEGSAKKWAKGRAKDKDKIESMIDFEVLLGQAFGDFTDLRQEVHLKDVSRTGKPYNCAELQKLEDSVKELMPLSGRLLDLEAACTSRDQGTLAAIKLLGRMDNSDFNLLTDHFAKWQSKPPSSFGLGYPWIESSDSRAKPYTVLRDMLDLMPFLETKQEKPPKQEVPLAK